MFRGWCKKQEEIEALPDTIESKDDEIRRLRAELESVKEDNEILKKASAYFCQAPTVKYAMLNSYGTDYSPSRRCCVLNASSSGYYDWTKKPKSDLEQRDDELKIMIKQLHTYGSPRIRADLKDLGESVDQKRVARLMREESVVARSIKVFKRTTNSNHKHPIAELSWSGFCCRGTQ